MSIPQNSIVVNYLSSSYPVGQTPTNYIPPPYNSLFTRYNISGNLSFTKTLQGHPTMTIQGVTPLSNLSTIENVFMNGNEFQIENTGYRVNGLTLVEESKTKQEGEWLFFSVSFTGKWAARGNTGRNPLDDAIKVTPLKVNDRVFFSRLCSARGVAYLGSPITIAVEADSKGQSTTIRSELEARAIKNGQFVYYSNPNAIEARNWANQTVHYLSDADILSEDIKKEYRGQGALFQGVPLSDEFRNTVVDFEESTKKLEESEEIGGSERLRLYVYENASSRQQVTRATVTRSGTFAYKLPEEVLREPSSCWNAGGFTKSFTLKTLLNGKEIDKRFTRYGLAFLSSDVYSISGSDPAEIVFNGGNPQTYWQKVEEWREKVIVKNKNEGYIVLKTKTGWRLEQDRKESNLDVINAQFALTQTNDPVQTGNNNRIIQQCQFKRKPIKEEAETTLEAFRRYYSDIPTPEKGDKDFVEPRFAKRIAKYILEDNSLSSTEDTAALIKPSRLVGKIFDTDVQIDIKVPSSKTSKKRKPELFTTTNFTRSQAGQFFLEGALLSQVTDNAGRPSVAPRIEFKVRSTPGRSRAKEDLAKFKYLLNSVGSNRSLTQASIGGSLSYPDVDNTAEALRTATTDLSIRNTQNALKMRLKVRFKRGYQEGDSVVFRGEVWIILGISDNRTIVRQGNTTELRSDSLELDLGKLLKPPVTISRIEVDGDGTT